MKKILCIALAVIFMFSILSGCGSKPATEQTSTKPAESTAAGETKKAEEPKAEAKKAEENVEISYFTWRVQPGKFPELFIDAFQKKYPNIKVNLGAAGISVEQYLNTQKVRLLSGDNIDVTTLRPESRAEYVKAGYLTDLTDQPFIQNYNPSMVDLVKVDGKVYSIPGSLNVIGVYYNKEIFAKLNLAEPKNWDEFLAVCDKIKAAGITPMENGGKDSWPMEFDIYPFLHSVLVKNPDIFTKVDKGEAKYTDPVFVEAFKNIKDFYKKGYIGKDMLSVGYDGANTLFRQGKTAMVIQGEWDMPNFTDKNKASFEIGVFPLPYNAAGEEIVVPVSIGTSEAVIASGKHKDAAMKFIEYMSTVEGAAIVSNNLACFTPVKGSPTDFNPLAKLWQPLLSMKSIDFFYNLQFPGANAEMLKGLQMMYLGKMTPEDLAKSVQTAQDKKAK